VRVTVLEATPSRSKQDRGLVRTAIETLNQRDEVVMSFKAMNLLRRRSSGEVLEAGG
jgi:acyl dehydratase